ncbi:unnamed protein product [Lactuca saligna]|uniref:Uncharacterized protein n=1 Tax=Lactuca saligna TaxID=75948 RepID=A0AA36A205_LACSI|nr:unnamed protein product [Lactuca saligna]
MTTMTTVDYTTLTKVLESLYKIPTSPEYLFQGESIAQRRSWCKNLTYYTGIGYLSGAVVSAGKGLVEDVKDYEASDTMKLKAAMGPRSAAVAGVIGGIAVGLARREEVLEFPKNETDLGVVEEPPVVASEVEASKHNSELKVEPVMKEADDKIHGKMGEGTQNILLVSPEYVKVPNYKV